MGPAGHRARAPAGTRGQPAAGRRGPHGPDSWVTTEHEVLRGRRQDQPQGVGHDSGHQLAGLVDPPAGVALLGPAARGGARLHVARADLGGRAVLAATPTAEPPRRTSTRPVRCGGSAQVASVAGPEGASPLGHIGSRRACSPSRAVSRRPRSRGVHDVAPCRSANPSTHRRQLPGVDLDPADHRAGASRLPPQRTLLPPTEPPRTWSGTGRRRAASLPATLV